MCKFVTGWITLMCVGLWPSGLLYYMYQPMSHRLWGTLPSMATWTMSHGSRALPLTLFLTQIWLKYIQTKRTKRSFGIKIGSKCDNIASWTYFWTSHVSQWVENFTGRAKISWNCFKTASLWTSSIPRQGWRRNPHYTFCLFWWHNGIRKRHID